MLTVIRALLFINAETLATDAAERQPFSGMAQVSAWSVYKGRAERSGDAQTKNRHNALKAVVCYERATHCPDLTNIKEAFEMRSRTAELALRQLNDPQLASNLLKDWLPPAHLALRDTTKEHVAADMKHFYEPETLVHAQLIAIEAHMMLANPQQLSLTEFPLEKRLAAAQNTLAEAERATLPKNQGANPEKPKSSWCSPISKKSQRIHPTA